MRPLFPKQIKAMINFLFTFFLVSLEKRNSIDSQKRDEEADGGESGREGEDLSRRTHSAFSEKTAAAESPVLFLKREHFALREKSNEPGHRRSSLVAVHDDIDELLHQRLLLIGGALVEEKRQRLARDVLSHV